MLNTYPRLNYYTAYPVTSIQEAENSPIDITGNPVIYLNSNENEIYLKKFNVTTGKTVFAKYVYQKMVSEEPTLEDKIDKLAEKYDMLYNAVFEKSNDTESVIKSAKKEVKND